MTTTPNSADLEAAAKAICKSEGFDWDVQDNMTTPNGEEPEQMREHYRSAAKAALSALSSRQPDLVEALNNEESAAGTGALAEVIKDLRRGGFPEAADLVEKKTLPETIAIHKQNAKARANDQTAPDAGLVGEAASVIGRYRTGKLNVEGLGWWLDDNAGRILTALSSRQPDLVETCAKCSNSISEHFEPDADCKEWVGQETAKGKALRATDQSAQPDLVEADDLVKHMVNRFLGWRLPEHFMPDAGISFEREYNIEHMAAQGKPPMRHEPTGTNLFCADQTEQMVRYMLEGAPLRALKSDTALGEGK